MTTDGSRINTIRRLGGLDDRTSGHTVNGGGALMSISGGMMMGMKTIGKMTIRNLVMMKASDKMGIMRMT